MAKNVEKSNKMLKKNVNITIIMIHPHQNDVVVSQ